MKIDKGYLFFNSVSVIYHILFTPLVIRVFTHCKKYLSKKTYSSKFLRSMEFPYAIWDQDGCILHTL